MLHRAIALLVALFACAALPAHADEKRLALILSNQDYPDSIGRLGLAHADARLVAAALKQTGFRTFSYEDQNTRETRAAIGAFQKAIEDEAADGDKVVVFFYAAMHGASEMVDGGPHNFLIPAREQIASTFDLIDRGIRLDALISALNSSKASAVVVVSNACRNSLRFTTSRSASTRGFTAEYGGPKMMVAFATGEGAVAPDTLVFANTLSAELVKPGRLADQAIFETVRGISRQRDWGSQPHFNGALPDWLCFKGCEALTTAVAAAAPAPETVHGDSDDEMWASARRVNTVEGYDIYMRAYPKGKNYDRASQAANVMEMREKLTGAYAGKPAEFRYPVESELSFKLSYQNKAFLFTDLLYRIDKKRLSAACDKGLPNFKQIEVTLTLKSRFDQVYGTVNFSWPADPTRDLETFTAASTSMPADLNLEELTSAYWEINVASSRDAMSKPHCGFSVSVQGVLDGHQRPMRR